MQHYRYRASTSDGAVVDGVVQAASKTVAIEELRRQRLYPVELAQVIESSKSDRPISVGKTPALALFARTIATMLNAGLPVERAVAFAAAQSPNANISNAGNQVHQSLQNGSSFADALQEHPDIFGPVFVTMVAAGEATGDLDDAFSRLADHLEELSALRSQIGTTLLYPALMAVAAGSGIIVLLLFVVPRFIGMLAEEGGTLPLSTRLLVLGSQIVVHGWWVMLIIAAVAVVAGRAWLANPENHRRLHAWRLSLPLVGELELKYATARFTRALGMLLKTGRSEISSLRAARATVLNRAMGAELDRAIEDVSHGKSVYQALGATLPPLATELIAVGEQSGQLDDLCLRVADTYDVDVRRVIRTLVALLEPALIVVFGLIVGFVALAMLQAIYSINRSVF
jgi:general secretion pathway protein F